VHVAGDTFRASGSHFFIFRNRPYARDNSFKSAARGITAAANAGLILIPRHRSGRCRLHDRTRKPLGGLGADSPQRVWAAPTVLRLGLVLSPEFGRGAATPRTRWVPPVSRAGRYLCCLGGGNPRVSRAGLGARVLTRDNKNAGPRLLRDCYLVPGGAKTGRGAERLRLYDSHHEHTGTWRG
jgi:hypothetical protein